MTFTKLSGITYFFKTFRAWKLLFKISRLFRVFHDRMKPECEERVSGVLCVCGVCGVWERERKCVCMSERERKCVCIVRERMCV